MHIVCACARVGVAGIATQTLVQLVRQGLNESKTRPAALAIRKLQNVSACLRECQTNLRGEKSNSLSLNPGTQGLVQTQWCFSKLRLPHESRRSIPVRRHGYGRAILLEQTWTTVIQHSRSVFLSNKALHTYGLKLPSCSSAHVSIVFVNRCAT